MYLFNYGRPCFHTPVLVNMYGVIKKCVYSTIQSIVHNCRMEKNRQKSSKNFRKMRNFSAFEYCYFCTQYCRYIVDFQNFLPLFLVTLYLHYWLELATIQLNTFYLLYIKKSDCRTEINVPREKQEVKLQNIGNFLLKFVRIIIFRRHC